ncbi:hypothetical protein DI487_02520 [Flavobacterium sediminis]|uniref:Uncharacterized protein n=1 Tax=Flavobacterium sediminis TaxID=2201181 RepID=A0A2U8QRX8_9FLAO|nr:hypothetical protein [Flavobacterium sediminis]AWM12851.1 hypothetical protein DI487_02520 [Flavobacterium sediminis]
MSGYYGSPKTVIKNNKDLLGEKNRLSIKDYLSVKHCDTKDSIKSSLEQLEAIRTKLQVENKKRKKRQIILAALSLFLSILLLYIIPKITS